MKVNFIKQLLFAGSAAVIAMSMLFAPLATAQSNRSQGDPSDITIEEWYRINDITFFGRDKAVSFCSGGGGGDINLVGGENQEKAFNYFVDQGLTPEQSAGIVGNLIQESGVDPKSNQPGGPGRGIAQWSEGERWETLKSFASDKGEDPESLGLQLDFLWNEFQTTENAAFKAIKAADSIEDATVAFSRQFERCGICHDDKRINYAKQVLAKFGDGSSGGDGSDSGDSDSGSGGGCDSSDDGGGSVGTGELLWPVDGKTEIQSCHGPRPQLPRITGGFHYGIDIGAPVGTPVVAAADGKVVTAEASKGFGPYFVRIDHTGEKTTSNYAHMSSYSVKVGDQVEQGQKIGEVGFANTAHLHFETLPLDQDYADESSPGYDPAERLKKPKDVPNNSINGGCKAFE